MAEEWNVSSYCKVEDIALEYWTAALKWSFQNVQTFCYKSVNAASDE